MAKPREFTTVPARAIADTRLTALDLRALMAIAIHDGMSTVKGAGPGCYAKLSTLAELARTDISNLSKALSRLIKFGYVIREPQQNDKRRNTHRVIYGDDDSWRTDQQSTPCKDAEKVGEFTNHRGEIVGEEANSQAKLVGEAEYLSDENSKKNDPHYISLNEELNSVETDKLNSVETAHLAFRETRADWNCLPERGQSPKAKRDCAEAPAASGSLRDYLPKSFPKLPDDGTRLVHFEQAFDKNGRTLANINKRERDTWQKWLLGVVNTADGTPSYEQALRLYWEVAEEGATQ